MRLTSTSARCALRLRARALTHRFARRALTSPSIQNIAGLLAEGDGAFQSLEVITDEKGLYSMRFFDQKDCAGATVGFVPEKTAGGCKLGQCCIGTWFVGTEQHLGFIPGRVSDKEFENECKGGGHGGRTAAIVIVIIVLLAAIGGGVYVYLKKRGGYTSF